MRRALVAYIPGHIYETNSVPVSKWKGGERKDWKSYGLGIERSLDSKEKKPLKN